MQLNWLPQILLLFCMIVTALVHVPLPFLQVRWADLEEQKEEQKRRLQMGFVLGSSWARVPEEQVTAILHGQRRISSSSTD